MSVYVCLFKNNSNYGQILRKFSRNTLIFTFSDFICFCRLNPLIGCHKVFMKKFILSLYKDFLGVEFSGFYPTALKGCQGIVFTHGVRMGRQLEKVCPGCISETVRCRKAILGRDIG